MKILEEINLPPEPARKVMEEVGLRCNRCKVEHKIGSPEVQEFTTISSSFGYHSEHFGDLIRATLDLCESCFAEILGPFCEISDNGCEDPVFGIQAWGEEMCRRLDVNIHREKKRLSQLTRPTAIANCKSRIRYMEKQKEKWRKL